MLPTNASPYPGLRVECRRPILFICPSCVIDGSAGQFPGLFKLPAVCGGVRLCIEYKSLVSWFTHQLGDLTLHTRGIVLKEVHRVNIDVDERPVEILRPRLLPLCFGLIQTIEK